ncbi:Tudor and KH domain-containing protein, partial [Stegodyphus mimosarum]
MSEHYSKAPFKENTKVALACGSIVVAKRHLDEKWHRGRVVDATDSTGPAKIFFVDFGNQEWVPRKLIREILPEYLHTPFQAIECSLSDIEPVNHEKGAFWSKSAIKTFMQLVERQVLLAEITYRLGKVLHVKLMKTSRESIHKPNIGDYLVSACYAQYQR